MTLVSASLAGIVLLRFWEEFTITALIHTEHSYRYVLPQNRDLHWAVTAGGTKAGLSIPQHQPPGLSRTRKADGQNRQSFSSRKRQTSYWKLYLCWGLRKGVSNCRVAKCLHDLRPFKYMEWWFDIHLGHIVRKNGGEDEQVMFASYCNLPWTSMPKSHLIVQHNRFDANLHRVGTSTKLKKSGGFVV
jgi:hypothetical protein